MAAPMLTQQQFLAQNAAAYAAQQAAPYMVNPAQDPNSYMAAMTLAPPYYGMPPWPVYPAGLIPQQGTQPRRPLTPSQGAENQPFVSIIVYISMLHRWLLFTNKTCVSYNCYYNIRFFYRHFHTPIDNIKIN